MASLRQFHEAQIRIINDAAEMAEELVSNYYKLSATQWLHRKYDIKTLADLNENEIVEGPFAQIVRYEGKRKDTSLGSSAYDFYKICLQDHSIRDVIDQYAKIKLLPFALYIIAHELIHIVRFTQFLQGFDVSSTEKMAEENRVHRTTREILKPVRVSGMTAVLAFYRQWHALPAL